MSIKSVANKFSSVLTDTIFINQIMKFLKDLFYQSIFEHNPYLITAELNRINDIINQNIPDEGDDEEDLIFHKERYLKLIKFFIKSLNDNELNLLSQMFKDCKRSDLTTIYK
jgi:hypothetical protein